MEGLTPQQNAEIQRRIAELAAENAAGKSAAAGSGSDDGDAFFTGDAPPGGMGGGAAARPQPTPADSREDEASYDASAALNQGLGPEFLALQEGYIGQLYGGPAALELAQQGKAEPISGNFIDTLETGLEGVSAAAVGQIGQQSGAGTTQVSRVFNAYLNTVLRGMEVHFAPVSELSDYKNQSAFRDIVGDRVPGDVSQWTVALLGRALLEDCAASDSGQWWETLTADKKGLHVTAINAFSRGWFNLLKDPSNANAAQVLQEKLHFTQPAHPKADVAALAKIGGQIMLPFSPDTVNTRMRNIMFLEPVFRGVANSGKESFLRVTGKNFYSAVSKNTHASHADAVQFVASILKLGGAEKATKAMVKRAVKVLSFLPTPAAGIVRGRLQYLNTAVVKSLKSTANGPAQMLQQIQAQLAQMLEYLASLEDFRDFTTFESQACTAFKRQLSNIGLTTRQVKQAISSFTNVPDALQAGSLTSGYSTGNARTTSGTASTSRVEKRVNKDGTTRYYPAANQRSGLTTDDAKAIKAQLGAVGYDSEQQTGYLQTLKSNYEARADAALKGVNAEHVLQSRRVLTVSGAGRRAAAAGVQPRNTAARTDAMATRYKLPLRGAGASEA